MAKKLIYLLLSLVIASSCTIHGKYIAYYFTYDPVDVRAYPSDTSKVIMKAICIRPNCYDEKQFDVPSAVFHDNNLPVPIGITKYDETGQWGYFSEKIPLLLDYHGWVKLSQLVPCGPADENVALPTYEVIPDKLIAYKHPRVSDKDRILTFGPGVPSEYVTFKKGERVQITNKKNGWGFGRYIYTGDNGKTYTRFGWVPMKSLKEVGSISYKDLQKASSVAHMNDEIAGSKRDGKFFQWGVKHWSKLRPILLAVNNYAAIAAIAFALLFLIPGIIRRRWMGPAIVLPVFAVYLFILANMSEGPGIMYGLAIPVAAIVFTYPLLYTPLSRSVPLIQYIIGIGGSIYVMFVNEIFMHESLILHIILFLAYCTVTVWFTRFMTKKFEDDICPRCGYYAGHAKLGEEYVGTTSQNIHHSDRVYDHSETSGNVRTDYYKDRSWVETKHTDHYLVGRCCARCGCEFENSKDRVRTERH